MGFQGGETIQASRPPASMYLGAMAGAKKLWMWAKLPRGRWGKQKKGGLARQKSGSFVGILGAATLKRKKFTPGEGEPNRGCCKFRGGFFFFK